MSFGPYLSSKIEKRTEKEWPPSPKPEHFFKMFHMKDFVEVGLFVSQFNKFYGAEWQEEKDWLAEYMGWIVFEKYRWLNKTELDF